MPFLQRKYVDLIRHVSSKWGNWDPPIPVEVGAYGEVEYETGELRIDGNIYDPDFQAELDRLGLRLRMSDYPPEESGAEEDFIIASKGAKQVNLHAGPEATAPGIVDISIKGQWQFEQGKRDALLIMSKPRLRFLPRRVILNNLYKVEMLKDKWLVTSVHVCPAYSMYLSDKSGENISLELRGQIPVAAGIPGVAAGGSGGARWWSNIQSDFLRKACDPQGNYCYTPLYTMKRKIGWLQRIFREGEEERELTGDELWQDVSPPWDPLDEDGEIDAVEDGDDNEYEF